VRGRKGYLEKRERRGERMRWMEREEKGERGEEDCCGRGMMGR
jgi:hypothetical protein